MNKLDKAIKILEKRLPKSHFIKVKQYKTVHSLMRCVARLSFNGNLKKCVAWYTEYLENPKKATYINTKYYPKREDKRKCRIKGYDIAAVAGTPIKIAYNQVKHRPMKEIAFLLLHEMGHHYYGKKYNEWLKEDWCDKFAIMWSRRLIREGILK